MILDLTRDSFWFLSDILGEFFDVIVLSLALGYIFSDMFQPQPVHSTHYDPIAALRNRRKNNFIFAVAVTAPAVILHELMHKVVAVSFGIHATFYAAYGWLILGILLKAFGSPILFFVPGFVAHGAAPPFVQMLVSIAGPLTNCALWLIARMLFMRSASLGISKKYLSYLFMTSRVNMFLFFFNMIPIPPFDGGQFVVALLALLFG